MEISAVFQAHDIVNRFKNIINELSLNEYTFKNGYSASIGAHLRHCIDFAQVLIRDLPRGEICYDQRDRSDLLENNPQFALMALSDRLFELEKLSQSVDHNKVLKIRQSNASDSELVLESNFLRELLYVQDHAIHHLAIIQNIAVGLGKKIALKEVENYSTQKYNASMGR